MFSMVDLATIYSIFNRVILIIKLILSHVHFCLILHHEFNIMMVQSSTKNLHAVNKAKAECYSHFTFKKSEGKFVVLDIQGCGLTFCDPEIATTTLCPVT